MAAAVPAVRVADVEYNVQEIEKIISFADGEHVEIVCFPELCITGYTCQDLFKEQLLLTKSEDGLLMLLDFTRKLDIICIVGLAYLIFYTHYLLPEKREEASEGKDLPQGNILLLLFHERKISGMGIIHDHGNKSVVG